MAKVERKHDEVALPKIQRMTAIVSRQACDLRKKPLALQYLSTVRAPSCPARIDPSQFAPLFDLSFFATRDPTCQIDDHPTNGHGDTASLDLYPRA